MKNIRSRFMCSVILVGVVLFVGIACSKEKDQSGLPVLTTATINNVTRNSANSGGNILLRQSAVRLSGLVILANLL